MNADFTAKTRRREETRLTGANRANRVLPSPLSQLPHVELSGERPALGLSPRGRRKSAAGAIFRPFQFFSSAEASEWLMDGKREVKNMIVANQ